MSIRVAKSAALFVMGPRASDKFVIGTTPAVEMIPIVGFNVNKAALPAGIINDPCVSVPIENGAKPALTETAEPEEEPPGFYIH